MRLIHVVPAIAEESSGPTYSVTRLCESLIELGNDLTLAALDWNHLPAAPAYFKAFPLGLGPRRLGRSPAMYRWLRTNTASGSVDILHNHGMWQMNSVYPGRASRSTSARLVVSPRGAFSRWAMHHGSWTKALFWPLLQRPALRQAACFHATSEQEYSDIRRLGFNQPVAVIPNGIDLPPDASADPVDGRQTLLFLGRIHRTKGLDLLLQAWKGLQSSFPHWDLLIVGSDKGYGAGDGYLAALQQTAADLGLKRITFAGELLGAGKLAAFRRADLFVLPTRSENFGIAVAEALAAGTPAVVSHGAPWHGLVEQGAGWWVEISVESLIGALEEAMRLDRAALKAMGQRGREWMRRDFAWPGIGRRMDGTYRWLIGESTHRPEWIRID